MGGSGSTSVSRRIYIAVYCSIILDFGRVHKRRLTYAIFSSLLSPTGPGLRPSCRQVGCAWRLLVGARLLLLFNKSSRR